MLVFPVQRSLSLSLNKVNKVNRSNYPYQEAKGQRRNFAHYVVAALIGAKSFFASDPCICDPHVRGGLRPRFLNRGTLVAVGEE